ncbi:hypothetical protein PR202_ga30161 [Eleusine coracana subsp. coracana]|uniref:Uncharacterized protein n=1 Tax=Eleusine coracana subsp. coracana TaxID=191504 RepID=A0AAV5DLS9_ELECO|nr:hypothetical protein PR202_ga30161 [Eleusine coracana subsp. coracana]
MPSGSANINEYEQRRLENVERNKRRLTKLNIHDTLNEMAQVTPKKTTKKKHNTRTATTEPPTLHPRQRRNYVEFQREQVVLDDLDVIGNFLSNNEDINNGKPSNGPVEKRKGRGITKKDDIFSRKPDMPKIKILLNDHGQPVGKNSRELSSVVGCQVRKKLSLASEAQISERVAQFESLLLGTFLKTRHGKIIQKRKLPVPALIEEDTKKQPAQPTMQVIDEDTLNNMIHTVMHHALINQSSVLPLKHLIGSSPVQALQLPQYTQGQHLKLPLHLQRILMKEFKNIGGMHRGLPWGHLAAQPLLGLAQTHGGPATRPSCPGHGPATRARPSGPAPRARAVPALACAVALPPELDLAPELGSASRRASKLGVTQGAEEACWRWLCSPEEVMVDGYGKVGTRRAAATIPAIQTSMVDDLEPNLDSECARS